MYNFKRSKKREHKIKDVVVVEKPTKRKQPKTILLM